MRLQPSFVRLPGLLLLPALLVLLPVSLLAGGYGEPRRTSSIVFSPGGGTIAFARAERDSGIYLLDAATGDEQIHIQAEGTVNDLEFSPDGSLLAAGLYLSTEPSAGRLLIADAATGEVKTRHDTPALYWIEFLDDGETVAYHHFEEVRHFDVSSGEDKTVDRPWSRYDYSARGARRLETVHTGAGLRAVTETGLPNGEGAEASLLVEELGTGILVHRLTPKGRLRQLFFSPDGRGLVSVSGPPENRLEFWNLTDGSRAGELAPGSAIHGAAFCPRGCMLALNTDGRDGYRGEVLLLYETATLTLLDTLPAPR